MPTATVTFGEALRRERLAASMTRQQLADALGWAAQRISNLERNDRPNPSWGTVQALADALGISTDRLRSATPAKN